MTAPAAVEPLPLSVFRAGLLDGQVAFVTGGATGIGLGISRLLAGLGAHVVMGSRKLEHLEPAAAAIGVAGGAASVEQLDVRDVEQVKGAVGRVRDRLGRIDLLVNNAAGNFYAPSETLSPNAWKSVLEIDLYGTFYCCQAVAPLMREQGGGAIVSTSMTLHYRGWPQMAHATAAKAGVDALTKTLAVEWAPHRIRVNAVAPGPVPTDGVRKAFTPPAGGGVTDVFEATEQAMSRYARKSIPLGRWGTPDDVAGMVAYLASPAGSWITGAVMVVDGGEWLSKQ